MIMQQSVREMSHRSIDVGGENLTIIMARKAKPMRTLSTLMSSMERGRLVSTVVLKPGIIPLISAPACQSKKKKKKRLLCQIFTFI